jgi:hypothetical protein
MRKIVIVAIVLAALAGSALPAFAAPKPADHLYNEVPYLCIALAAHHAGHSASGQACGQRRSQLWTIRVPRIITASRLCLTATARKHVITARCGWRHGQRWTLLRGSADTFGSHRIESQRFGSCLTLSPSYTGPVRLGPCRSVPVIDGGTGYWIVTR